MRILTDGLERPALVKSDAICQGILEFEICGKAPQGISEDASRPWLRFLAGLIVTQGNLPRNGEEEHILDC